MKLLSIPSRSGFIYEKIAVSRIPFVKYTNTPCLVPGMVMFVSYSEHYLTGTHNLLFFVQLLLIYFISFIVITVHTPMPDYQSKSRFSINMLGFSPSEYQFHYYNTLYTEKIHQQKTGTFAT